MTPERVSVRVVDDDGEPMARCVFSDVAFTVPVDAVAFAAGVLRISIPAVIEAPLGATIIERWLPPTDVQVRLAVESLDASAVERVMLREMDGSPGESMGALARRAVALVCAGDRGAD